MKMAVAVVNYNTCAHLEACLETAVAEHPVQTIVVDNASTDGSPEMVAEDFPQVELVTAPNEGFGAGANIALQHAGAPYVLLLNSDTRLHPGTLDALAGYLDAHPHVGMVGPRLVNPDGSLQKSIYPAPSPVAELMRWTSLAAVARHIPSLRRKYFVDCPHDRAEPVGWVVGAALAIRKEAFDAVGGFDTSFFMYSEEVDLAYSMEEAGWEVHFTPVATVTHFGGASTQAYRADMLARLYASMHHFYRKHYSPRRQRQLRAIITYFMVRNLLRDRWRLLRSNCPTQCEQLAQDVAAWRAVLRLTWGMSRG
jgi:N-acetylglucosaminyl-diphospho-decaprenol L-rhamnosyltransferase